ncbi:chlorophyllase-1 [Canna indica]|uniref:Chlorophyllase-1 n=1 Tax=Canna indica TaxID=4628 RepID=A0AAQ3QLM7_9LILI|nr:chlorophyllase-1 [Canna indica]
MAKKAESISVFELGKLEVQTLLIKLEPSKKDDPSPPRPLLVASPKDPGRYPVILLLHGFFLDNTDYRQILLHIASHGFILVAPELYDSKLAVLWHAWSDEDIIRGAKVIDWLPTGLQPALPTGVEANLDRLAIAGHSRGGHSAFSLALGYGSPNLPFSALVGIDPVAGSEWFQVPPRILAGDSPFELGIPVLVIGTGLGHLKKNPCCLPCAPDGFNHEDFYNKCKRTTGYHVVVSEYGHMDILDDDAPFTKCTCKNGVNCRDIMRRTTADLVVAFAEAHLEGDGGDLKAILNDPKLAPTELYPVEYHE